MSTRVKVGGQWRIISANNRVYTKVAGTWRLLDFQSGSPAMFVKRAGVWQQVVNV